MKIIIRGGRVIDPSQNLDGEKTLIIEDKKIKGIFNKEDEPPLKGEVFEINLEGQLVLPGFVDIHVHIREPGEEWKEDIESASLAAVKGGFTTIVAMPNTKPPNDSAQVTAYIIKRSKSIGMVNVLPAGKITTGNEQKKLAPMGEMVCAGAVCFTEDGDWLPDSRIMERALEYSKFFNFPILSHPEDPHLSKGGQINEGKVSLITGLQGIPAQAEEIAVFRDIKLAELTKARLHLQHISTKGSVEIIRWAKMRGMKNLTCEVTPHHFSLTEDILLNFNTNAKVKPPLRTEEDRRALIEGIKDGIIDCIATDHAPHSSLEKDVEFTEASFGISSLETALPLSLNLVREGIIDFRKFVELLSLNPSKIIGIDRGTLQEGKSADVVIVDPDEEWIVTPQTLVSKGKNTPFLGKKLKGLVLYTIFEGKLVYTKKKNE